MTATSVIPKNKTKWSLVLALLIGPFSWSLFFLVGYLIAEAACMVGFFQGTFAGFNLVLVVVVALGLLATAVTAWGAFSSYRRWRSSSSDPQQTEDLATFLALAAMLLNLLFLVANLTTALGMLFILPCQWT